ncbi:MAG: hypothetical protein M3N08_10550 [Pseudomonadota bacterium]|nr:hypothetical protein [Pseudomonadota bacterium]
MKRSFLLLMIAAQTWPLWSGQARANDRPPGGPTDRVATVGQGADLLLPPPLPPLDKGAWNAEKTVMPHALYVEDELGGAGEKSVSLAGTKYSAHLDYTRRSDAPDDDLMNRIASGYDEALAQKSFEYRVQIPGSRYFLVGATADAAEDSAYGQSVVADGKLRYIAVTTHESDGEGSLATEPSPTKIVHVTADIDIFVSDAVPLPEILQKISAK